MPGSTRLRKAADAKPLSHEEVYSLLNSLQSEVSSLKSARNSDAAEMQSLRLALSPPYPQNQQAVSSAYDQFMQEPYRAVDQSNHLLNDGSNFAEWVAGLNRVLCIVFESKLAISHFIDATIPPNFALCIGVILARTSSKDFFNSIKVRCCPGNRFKKLKVVRDLGSVLIENGAGQPQSNTTIILTLRRAFAMFRKLGVDANELEGLLAQAACHAPPNVGQVAFDQLVTAAILAKGDKKPSSTFVGQVIMNTSQRNVDSGQCPSPFVYCMSDPLAPAMQLPRPCSPFFPNLLTNQAMCTVLLSMLSTGLEDRASIVDVRDTGKLTFQLPKGLPTQILSRLLLGLPVQFARERLRNDHRPNQPLTINENTGASIHLSGSHHFATSMEDIPPFCIFLANSNSSITILQTTTLKLPVKNGFVIIRDIPFSQKSLGTILLVGRLCRAGVMPLFNGLSLSLLVLKVLVTTTFENDCWWLDIVPREETSWSAAASSSHCLLEMNLISLPTSVSLSARGWH
ncbi:hypothetical protein O181_012733 [Austropuccinia psidii MF-1]|uniref:Uncharacterized protein n=1 Tax=Austropuccinia psidii MF-1 TaxID=1389203 RepID=A0A9Q3GMG8_9BASI|nr:hypothetical protein [Austropuccinia psidii MF-1]